jgi:hypothetical protein
VSASAIASFNRYWPTISESTTVTGNALPMPSTDGTTRKPSVTKITVSMNEVSSTRCRSIPPKAV